MSPKISICIITKNEELNIGRCIDSVAGADEIIVVDSGSTDKTVELATAKGARVITHAWPGWAKQKNYCIEQATNDWILSLDADEWLGEGTLASLRTAIDQSSYDAFRLRRKTYFMGRFIAHSGWYPDQQIRLFRKSITRFAEVPVHEMVEQPERWTDLPVDIEHQSYRSLSAYVEKSNAYTSAQATQQQHRSHPWIHLFLRPPYRFLFNYIRKAGFLDGWQGFILACLCSWYDFLVCAKIIELNQNQNS